MVISSLKGTSGALTDFGTLLQVLATQVGAIVDETTWL